MPECTPHQPVPVTQAACLPSNFVCSSFSAPLPQPSDYIRPDCVCPENTDTCVPPVTFPFLVLQQILGPLDHDDQCGKQKLAYKLEQVITLMSLDS